MSFSIFIIKISLSIIIQYFIMKKERVDIQNGCRKIYNKVNYFSKAFLQPMEIVEQQKQGIKIVKWEINSQDRYTGTEIKPQLDNLLSLYKRRNEVKLAICVCAYSQSKDMLKKTLLGIEQNYKQFYKIGISPEEIVVIVIFDGIQTVDESIQQYFDEMDYKSDFKWKDYGRSIRELEKYLNNPSIIEQNSEDSDDQIINLKQFNLYPQDKLKQLSKKLFPYKKKQYIKAKKMLQYLHKIKHQNLDYEDLHDEVKQECIEQMRKQYLSSHGIYIERQQIRKNNSQSFYLQAFHDKPDIIKHCIELAIKECQILYQKYISARDKISLLYTYREKIKLSQKRILQTYLFMCVKYKNTSKIASQKLFFNGFCKILQPKFTILLDVGLKPDKKALVKMYQHLDQNPKCGGVCGYMALNLQNDFEDLEDFDILTKFSALFFDIQRAQQFEYHYAHMLEKPFESYFRFINVLPGAFSGYNMQMFTNESAILKQYFKSLNQEQYQLKQQEYTVKRILSKLLLPDICNCNSSDQNQKFINYKTPYQLLKEKNIYLAEDRILCLSIFQKQFQMAFLPDSYAIVDPVTNLTTLLGQRKRWINGSYFAFQKVKETQNKQLGFWFCFQIFFYTFIDYFAYVSLAFFFVSLDMSILALVKTFQNLQSINQNLIQGIIIVIDFIYLMMLGIIFFLSLNVNQKNERYKKIYYLISSMLGLISLIVYVVLFLEIFRAKFTQLLPEGYDPGFKQIRFIIYAILIGNVIPPFIFFLIKRDFKYVYQVIISSFSYVFYAITYQQVLTIFAYCRIDDISWGTKGLFSTENQNQDQKTKKLKKAWVIEKYLFMFKYLIWNIIVAIIFMSIVKYSGEVRSYIIFICCLIVAIILVVKIIFGSFYLIRYYFIEKKWDKKIIPKLKFNDYYEPLKKGFIQKMNQYEDHLTNIIFNRFLDKIKKTQKVYSGVKKPKVYRPYNLKKLARNQSRQELLQNMQKEDII